MSKLAVLFADGCEEIEGLTVIDLLRRARIDVDMVSIMGRTQIQGSHGIAFITDTRWEDIDPDSYDGLVLPGGLGGTKNLGEHAGVLEAVKKFAESGKLTAAICAAPGVLGKAGILKGKHATCYPGVEESLVGAVLETDNVVIDGNIVTSRSLGTAIDFSLALIRYCLDEQAAKDIREGIVYTG